MVFYMQRARTSEVWVSHKDLRTSLSFSVGRVGGGYGVKRVFQRLEIIMHVYVVMKNAYHILKTGSHGTCLSSLKLFFLYHRTLLFLPLCIIRNISQHCFLRLKSGLVPLLTTTM